MSLATLPPQRIGVFGGAFDPPHVAHVALARAAIAQLQLDALHIIPTGHAWHKTRTLSPAVHRLAMTRLTFAGVDKVVVDPRETQRSGPSYTVDTLEALRDDYPAAQFFLIVGEDQAQSLGTWHRWQDVLQLATICVAARAGFTRATTLFEALHLAPTAFQLIEMPPMDVSATDIRLRVANHQSTDALVFEPVARYIDHHHLYQTA